MRWLVCVFVALAFGACDKEEIYFIPGTGTLPDCMEPPAVDLDGTCWFDTGTVTIRSAGCTDAEPDDTFDSCPLQWLFTQSGNDVTIIVDGEYRIEGRLCADQLHLRGGWWLLVADGNNCDYTDESSADEVGIQAEGNVLTYVPAADQIQGATLAGTLAVRGRCNADYEVTFQPIDDGCTFFD